MSYKMIADDSLQDVCAIHYILANMCQLSDTFPMLLYLPCFWLMQEERESDEEMEEAKEGTINVQDSEKSEAPKVGKNKVSAKV